MIFLEKIKLKNPNLPILVFDGDSVLLDWSQGFTDFLKSKGFSTDHYQHILGTTEFIPTEVMTKIDCKVENKKLMSEFADSNFLGDLPTFQEGSKEYIEELSKHYNIVVLSCIGETQEIINKRTDNLINLYGDIFSGIICINYGTSKESYLKALNAKFGVKAFVDDRIGHIQESLKAGVEAILYSRGVENIFKEQNEFMVLECWSEIHKHLYPQ